MTKINKITPHQVSVAAEAFVAALFARSGYNVSIQYGANQPEYDLLVEKKGGGFMKVSVKGSQDGGWGLIQSHKKNRSYYEAIDYWKGKHDPNIVFAFVQFQGVNWDEMPTVYLATILEVSKALKAVRNNNGNTTLRVKHVWKGGVANGTTDVINTSWRFNSSRIEEVIKSIKVWKI